MRTSNRGRRAAGTLALAATIVVAACGTAASPPPAPTPVPTPVITPDPHLAAPASVDDVFRILSASGLRIQPTTASGGNGAEPVKRIVASYAEWPLVLTQFSTPEALRKAGRFDPRKAPTKGDTPYALAGLNILIEFGPEATGKTPVAADEARQRALLDLVAALDPLVGPLAQRSVAPLPLPTLTPRPSAIAAPGASAAP